METRVNSTKKNMASGLLKQAILIILPFAIRTVMLYVLGESYLGLNGLFTSILAVLNLADLGFSSAVMFALYMPIANNDTETICAILSYLKKVYFYVGIVILMGGLAVMPFLKNLISGDIPEDVNIYALFFIYLVNAAISYMLFAYKSALLSAMQKESVVNNITSSVNIGLKLLQILFLCVFKSYYAFIVLLPIGTIINNLLLQFYSRRFFPEILPRGELDKSVSKSLSKQIRAVFLGKIGDTARNSLDNIVLSLFFGLVSVAIYDNYYYVYSSLYAITLVLTSAMQASVGNSIAKESIDKNCTDLQKFTFCFSWLTGWMTVTMLCVYQDFMYVWMHGNLDMMYDNFKMILFCIYFYAITMNNMRNLYVQGAGLFHECRCWYLTEAIANLTLNFVLGKLFGVSGIIVATILTIVAFNFIARTNILYKNYFRRSPKTFFAKHTLYALATTGICAITYIFVSVVNVKGIIGLLVKGALASIISNVLYYTIYRKTLIFRESLSFVKTVFHRSK